jgi:hypothetical protein
MAAYTSNTLSARNATLTWGETARQAIGLFSDETGGQATAIDIEQSKLDDAARRAAAAKSLLSAASDATPQNRAPDNTAIHASLEAMAEDTSKTHAQILSEQRDYIAKILANDKMEVDQRSALQGEFNRLTTEATIAAGDKLVEAARLSAEKAAAAAGPSRAAQVQAEISTYQALLASRKLTADQQMQVENEVAELQVQLVRRTASEGKKSAAEAWEAYKAGMDRQIEEARGNYSEQIRLLQQEVAEASKLYGQQSRQAQEALKAEAAVRLQAGTAAIKATEEQLSAQQDLARAQADFASIGAKPAAQVKPSIGLAFDHSGLDAQVAAEVAQMKSALDTNLNALQASITGKIDLAQTLTQGSDAYNELAKSAAADLAKMAADQKEFADKAVQIQQEAAQKVQDSWAKIGAPIEHAFSSIVGAAIGGGRNAGRAMEHAATGVVESWAKSGVDMLAHWAATQLGLTAATTAGSAARTAAQTPEEAQFISRLAAMLGVHLSTEASKTAATATGAAARTADEAASATAGRAVSAAINASTIQADAAVAAAGAYAATASIPIVGPALAPGAAAEAYGAVSSFQAAASAAGGWDRVPHDGYPTVLHQDEMVLPANVAGPVREMARAGLNAPTAASAAASMPGNSVTTNAGDVSHNASFSQTNHFHGASDQGAIQSALRSSNQDLNSRFSDWYGNTGTPTLPGRKVHK